MENLPRFLPESYWVEPGLFLAGEYPGVYNPERTRQRLDALLELGIDTFINLTRPDEREPYLSILREQAGYYGMKVTHHHRSIGDFGLPSVAEMKTTLDIIDQALANGHKVYLHCWGGIGRTGTTVGCYLARHGRSGPQALAQLAEWWRSMPKSNMFPHSPETEEQHAFVRDWPEQAHG